MGPHQAPQPFALDYIQVSFAFFEVLIEVYKRFATMLGPSHFPSSGNMGPPVLGVTIPTPTPGATNGLQSPTGTISDAGNYFDRMSPYPSSNPIGIGGIMPPISLASSNSGLGSTSSSFSHHGGSPPPIWNPSYGDMLGKVDQKFMVSMTIRRSDE